MVVPVAKKVNIRFYEELNDFLPEYRQKVSFEARLHIGQTVKDLIESLGVPHAEVDLILVNGQSVGFDYRLSSGDRISVYPVFESFDISTLTRLRPQPLRESRFILDVHLGSLARKLRLLGFDSLYRNDYGDDEIVRVAAEEKRIILTRDRGILKRSVVTRGYCLRNDAPSQQFIEVVNRFSLIGVIRPFSRCPRCNGKIDPVEKGEVLSLLQPGTIKHYNVFSRCHDCGQVYWKGKHWERILEEIRSLTGAD